MEFPVRLFCLLLISQLFDYQYLELPLALRAVFTITPDRLFLLLIFGSFAIAFFAGRLRLRPFSKIEACMCLFALVCTVSWYVAGRDWGLPSYRWLTTLFNLIYFPFGVYFVAKNTEYSREKIITLLRCLACIGMYLSFTALFEHYGVNALIWPKYILNPMAGIQFERARGPFVSSVAMGEALIVVLLSTYLLILCTKGRLKFFLHILTLLTLVGIYFTDQRSVWLSCAAVYGIMTFAGGNLRRYALRIAAVLVLAFLVGAGSKFSLYQNTLFSRRQNTVDYRIANFKTAVNMIKQNFFTGVGYGSFLFEWDRYFGFAEATYVGDLEDGNHNTFLGLFAETGVFGFALYVGVYFFLLRQSWSTYKNLGVGLELEKSIAIAAMALLTVALIEAQFTDLRFHASTITSFFLFSGIAASVGSSRPAAAAASSQPDTSGAVLRQGQKLA